MTPKDLNMRIDQVDETFRPLMQRAATVRTRLMSADEGIECLLCLLSDILLMFGIISAYMRDSPFDYIPENPSVYVRDFFPTAHIAEKLFSLQATRIQCTYIIPEYCKTIAGCNHSTIKTQKIKLFWDYVPRIQPIQPY